MSGFATSGTEAGRVLREMTSSGFTRDKVGNSGQTMARDDGRIAFPGRNSYDSRPDCPAPPDWHCQTQAFAFSKRGMGCPMGVVDNVVLAEHPHGPTEDGESVAPEFENRRWPCCVTRVRGQSGVRDEPGSNSRTGLPVPERSEPASRPYQFQSCPVSSRFPCDQENRVNQKTAVNSLSRIS